MFCPHCFNLNRTRDSKDRLPTNHYLRKTRDPTSDVVCPELTKTICENCGKPGHTRSYCVTPFRIENAQCNVAFSLIYAHNVGVNEKRCNKEKSIVSPSTVKKVLVQTPSGNRFQHLSMDDISSSDDDEEEGPPFRPRSPDYPPPDY